MYACTRDNYIRVSAKAGSSKYAMPFSDKKNVRYIYIGLIHRVVKDLNPDCLTI